MTPVDWAAEAEVLGQIIWVGICIVVLVVIVLLASALTDDNDNDGPYDMGV